MSYDSLYDLLSNRDYYSLEINYVSEETLIPVSTLRSSSLSDIFLTYYDDPLNVFVFNSLTYIGLESQRIRYEEDKESGTNWVEDAIARVCTTEVRITITTCSRSATLVKIRPRKDAGEEAARQLQFHLRVPDRRVMDHCLLYTPTGSRQGTIC